MTYQTIRNLILAGTAISALGAMGGTAQAQGQLVLYCAVQEEWCRAVSTAFEKETGIKVAMTRKSSGEFYAQLKAESANPRGDIWWGGTGDPHMQAAEEGLTEAYTSPNMSQLHDWAVKAHNDTKGRAVGIYTGALGFGYNAKMLAAKKLPEPKCWADLAKPEYKDEVQVADPNSSGTSYTMLATIVQLMGEDKAFEWLKAVHKNINQYTKSGAAPAKATSLGETTIGITFMHDMLAIQRENPDVKVVAPCEGTGYEIGSMSMVKGTRNAEIAKKFYDWALTPGPQALGAENKQFQTPSNKATPMPKFGLDMATVKLINYDFGKYGSSSVRNALLAKWDKDVKSAPK
ncbi:MAG TPA: ABC transporter substrate-binding protein [Beijerinckiaceae bacterium]|nr:ABC transporter substrate-binding protein [Beijerinckiaceae bacterium]